MNEIIKILEEMLKLQNEKMAETSSNFDKEKADCLSIAIFNLNEYQRLSKSN